MVTVLQPEPPPTSARVRTASSEPTARLVSMASPCMWREIFLGKLHPRHYANVRTFVLQRSMNATVSHVKTEAVVSMRQTATHATAQLAMKEAAVKSDRVSAGWNRFTPKCVDRCNFKPCTSCNFCTVPFLFWSWWLHQRSMCVWGLHCHRKNDLLLHLRQWILRSHMLPG